MKQISLTQGKVTLVDDDIYDVVKNLKWCWRSGMTKNSTGYAGKTFSADHGLSGMMFLHHVVAGYPLDNLIVDHIDGDGLNNQRNNLRIITKSENMANLKIHRNGRLRGCYKIKSKNSIYSKWRATIRIEDKVIHLGLFETEQEAHERHMQERQKRGLR